MHEFVLVKRAAEMACHNQTVFEDTAFFASSFAHREKRVFAVQVDEPVSLFVERTEAFWFQLALVSYAVVVEPGTAYTTLATGAGDLASASAFDDDAACVPQLPLLLVEHQPQPLK
jgi:hypothetical protein